MAAPEIGAVLCGVMKRKKLSIFCNRKKKKKSFKSWQRSPPLVQSTLLHQLSRRVPYLVFDFDVLIFLSQLERMGEILFHSLSFTLPRTQKNLLVTQTT